MNNSNISTKNEIEQIPLKEFILSIKATWTLLKSKKFNILIFTLTFSLVGLGIVYFEKPNYKATMTFALEEDKGSNGSGISGALGIASSLGIDLGGGGSGLFSTSNLSELFKSRLVIEKALMSPIEIFGKKKTLIEYYIEINNLRERWKDSPKTFKVRYSINEKIENFNITQDSIIKIIHNELLEKNINFFQKDKKISILTLEVKSQSENFSKFFCESLAKQLSTFYIETKSKKAKINVEILQKQADSVRNELNNAITSVASESDKVYNLNPALNAKGSTSRKKQIDVQANTAILTQLVAQLELSKVNLRKETPLIQIIDNPVFPLEKEKTGKLKGLLYGAFIGMILSSINIILISLYKKIMSS